MIPTAEARSLLRGRCANRHDPAVTMPTLGDLPGTPDVYRRADVALWTALISLPIAVASAVVVALAGARWSFQGGLVGALAGVCAVIVMSLGVGFKRRGRAPGTRLAPVGMVRVRLLRRILIGLVALVILVAVVGDADVLTWWYLPCVYAVVALGGALGWGRLARWEHRHPGATPVTELVGWRPDSYVWLADPAAPPVPPRTARGLRWMLGDR
jgi:hypothetical protein